MASNLWIEIFHGCTLCLPWVWMVLYWGLSKDVGFGFCSRSPGKQQNVQNKPQMGKDIPHLLETALCFGAEEDYQAYVDTAQPRGVYSVVSSMILGSMKQKLQTLKTARRFVISGLSSVAVYLQCFMCMARSRIPLQIRAYACVCDSCCHALAAKPNEATRARSPKPP